MRAACLIVLVALILPVTSIFDKIKALPCCDKSYNRIEWHKIKSYNRTDDNACKKSAYIVELRKGGTICVNPSSKNVQSAIKKFENYCEKKKLNVAC